MVFKKLREFGNTGFSSNINNEGERLITKDGKFNVKKEGLNFFQRFNLFHSLMNMPNVLFFSCLLLTFITINLFFSIVYLLIGLDGISGTTTDNGFYEAFFFSAQTLTTVGYGGLYPTGKAISLIASFEAFIGLLSFAVSTGLLYGRFSRPKSKILFSQNALISPYQDITGFMARVANPKNSQLINLKATMIFSQVISENDDKKRKFYTLELEMNKINLFVTSWTIVHPINEKSPLYQLNQQDFLDRNAEVVILLSAYDESYNQEVHSRTSYKSHEIISDAKFISTLGHNKKKQAVIHLNQLNTYELLLNKK